MPSVRSFVITKKIKTRDKQRAKPQQEQQFNTSSNKYLNKQQTKVMCNTRNLQNFGSSYDNINDILSADKSTPEHKLICAVIWCAVLDYARDIPPEPKLTKYCKLNYFARKELKEKHTHDKSCELCKAHTNWVVNNGSDLYYQRTANIYFHSIDFKIHCDLLGLDSESFFKKVETLSGITSNDLF